MSTDTVKALILSHMENELIDVIREISKHEGIINSHRTFYKHKQNSKKELLKLARQKMFLIDQIAEASLLDESKSI